MTNATTKTVCGKCAGSGEYHFRSGAIEACYPCDGTGRVEASVAAVRQGPRATTAEIVERTRLTLRTVYNNTRQGRTSYEEVTDGIGMWTVAGLESALDMVPGSREAFRGIGWPV